jgi:membrane protease YdiL (CAAX protease family)
MKRSNPQLAPALVAVFLLLLLSSLVIVGSVHTYCENRGGLVALAVVGILFSIFIIRTSLRRATKAALILSCLIAVGADSFVAWNCTKDCHRLEENLRKLD